MKSQKLLRLGAILMALLFCLTFMVGCDKDNENPNVTPGGTESGNTTAEDKTLVVAYDAFSEKFSPFFSDSAYDQDVQAMTQVSLMTVDRVGAIVYNAIAGETRSYNGTDYTYTGPADLTVVKNTDTTVYTLKIRDDIKFSDGHAANIDDVIFYYYVVLDPYYSGSTTLNSVGIVGYDEYRYNNSNVSGIENYDAAPFLADIDNQVELQEYVKEMIIKSVLFTEEWAWATGLYGNPSYQANATWAQRFVDYPETKDLIYALYGDEGGLVVEDATTAKDTKAMTADEVKALLVEEYGYDYKKLAERYAGDATYFDSNALTGAKLIGSKSVEGDEVPNISGIKRIDDYTVEVTTKGFSANAVYQVGAATLAPMHYYGDETLYDYANNKFGFNNRQTNSMELIDSKTTQPMGAGPYKFVKYENKVVHFEANENYFDGAPKIKYLQFKETGTNDMVPAIATGTADAVDAVTGSVEKFKEISGYNSNGEPTGDVITSSLVWNLGYGYIGINADTVRVGTDSGSTESKNLRKAFATIMGVYRESVIDSYYGDAASVIEYPISSTSWAAPQISDAGYTTAFSVDASGAAIYTADMDADAKYAAALEAAKSFFVAAGYTWDEAAGKFTAAPEGAKLEYELIIPAGGTGDHPNYKVADNARVALESIGITLKINDVSDSNILWDALGAGTQEMWSAAWGSTIDPDMYQVYYSGNIVGASENSTESNHYHINDKTLDDQILLARTSEDQEFRKAAYKTCLDIIMDWAVEIPAYQRKNVCIFSTERVNMDTMTRDITTYWGWKAELHLLEMN